MSFLYWTDEQGPAKGTKVLLATTAYDSPDASHTASIAHARAALSEAGIMSAYALLSGNCHVDDARNSIVASFLESDCTDLVFIDADVSFTPDQLVRLCTHENVDVVGGIYPKRATGHRDMPVRMLPDVLTPDSKGLLEVEGLPTGFMRIRRTVLKHLAGASQTFRKDLTVVPIIFERTYIDNVGRVGGDINFGFKALKAGFSLHADCELRLGHAAKVIVKDSLGAYLRRSKGKTLEWVADRVHDGRWQPEDLDEAAQAVGNEWAAPKEALIAAIKILEAEPGHVLETGSGLSTIIMAAAISDTTNYVYCLEHDPLYAEMTKRLARQAGITNIGMVVAPLDPETGWYNTADMEGLPDTFRLGFCDGPPRAYGSRTTFFTGGYARACDVVIADDAMMDGYPRFLMDWSRGAARDIAFEGRIAIVK